MALPSIFRGRESGLAPGSERDPFLALRREIDRMFEDFWRGAPFAPVTGGAFAPTPVMDVEQTDDAVLVSVELPGVDEKDVEVEVNGDILTVRGEKKAESENKDEGWRERVYGRFSRSVRLPAEVDADKAKGTFEKGVLKITLPKSEPARARSRKIQVKAA